ncbi:MAG: alkaline phosphatase family protein [Mycobacteriales bacterium]
MAHTVSGQQPKRISGVARFVSLTARPPARWMAAGTVLALSVAVAPVAKAASAPTQTRTGPVAAQASAAPGLPPVRHVFVIVLENKEFAEAFGAGRSYAPYLTQTLPAMGELMPNYFGTGHDSADNYLAMVAGQPPTFDSKNDCGDPLTTVPASSDANGIAQGNGCVYPPQFLTIADQLAARGLTWRGYAENLPAPCSLVASGPGNYARKHNPFVFFQSLRDSGQCTANDVGLSQLTTDLASPSTTPNYAFIIPDQCSDGHNDCTSSTANPAQQQTDELTQADAFLREWVPQILASKAFEHHGLLVITNDEGVDTASCCGEPATDPDGSSPGGYSGSVPGLGTVVVPGLGGGQVGAVLLSPFITPGSITLNQYNHYSLLRSVEDLFGLGHLAEAGLAGVTSFGSDVYTNWSG